MGNSPLFYDPSWIVRQILRNQGNDPTLYPPTNVGLTPNAGSTVGTSVDTSTDTISNMYGVSTSVQTMNDLSELATLHGTLLSKALEISTGTGDQASYQQPSAIVKRPWIDPPDGSVSYDQHGVLALPVPGNSGNVLSFTVPDGYDGVINAFSWNFVGGGFTDGSGTIIVQLLRGNAAIRNYDNILVQCGTVGVPRPISPIRIYSGQTITMFVNHASDPTLNGNVVGSILGYFYPSMS